MSRAFASASSQYLESTAHPVTNYPFTLVAWMNPTTLAATMTAIALSSTTASSYCALGTLSTGKAFIEMANGGASDTTGLITVTTGKWQHIGAVCTSSTQRDLYVGGVFDTTNTASVTFAGTVDQMNIGCIRTAAASRSSFFNGLIAHGAAWNVALNADEMKLLATGTSPLHIRPANLVSYVPVKGNISPEPDYMQSATYAVTGATAGASEPPMSQLNNNYQSINVGNGMSVGEKIR